MIKGLFAFYYFLKYFSNIGIILRIFSKNRSDKHLFKRGGICVQEYQCSSCGYRKMERNMVDFMGQFPMYSGFGSGFMLSFSNNMNLQENTACPNCGKASSWKSIINNSN